MEALDNPDYDPVAHLQVLFAGPSNLEKLPDVSRAVYAHKKDLSQRIADNSTQIRKHTENDDYAARVESGTHSLVQLHSRISSLRAQAYFTESKITNMTSHIISLDKTKSNLIYSITVLKRLQMLTTAYDQLSGLVVHRHYHEMAQTLMAVQELMSHFKPFRSISQIAALSRQIGDIQVKITDQIFADFETVLSGKGDSDLSNSLADATAVLELLGDHNKTKLINWYCSTQLREYRTIFRNSDEAGSLENIGRRFAYFKRILKQHVDSNSKYFDPSWHMAEELTNTFCNNTRDDIQALLSENGGKNTNVQTLLQALQETLDFEQYLEKRFESVSDSRLSTDRRRVTPTEDVKTTLKSGKAISLAFQPHLNIWIDYQDKQLSLKFAQFKAPPLPHKYTDGEPDPDPTVLPSSAELFIFYRQILAQTCKLSTGEPLVNLSRLFGKWLDIYCSQILNPTFPARLNDETDFKTLALVVATADYCTTTISQLEEKLQSSIDDSLKEMINFDNERGRFLDVVNLGIKRLVGKVETALEMSWREMANTAWSKLDTVGDQSSYAQELTRALLSEVKTVLHYTSKKTYVRLVCDKIVESVAHSFLAQVVKCRPISEIASEQMLLDLYVVKNTLLKLPSLAEGADPTAPPASLYSKHVSGSIGRVETILKVVLTQTTPPEGLVQNYFYLIGDRSVENFRKILDIKGLSRSEQARFVELFHAHMKAHDNLVDDSPILQSLRLSGAGSTTHSNGYGMLGSGGSSGAGHNAFSGSGTRSVSGGGLPFNLGSNSASSSNVSKDLMSGRATPVNEAVSAFAASLSPPNLHLPKFEPAKGFVMAKDQIEKSLEKISQEKPVTKINENFRTFGRLFRRDTNQ